MSCNTRNYRTVPADSGMRGSAQPPRGSSRGYAGVQPPRGNGRMYAAEQPCENSRGYAAEQPCRMIGTPGITEPMPIAMAYVPWQQFKHTFDLEKAIEIGTIFPELDKPFTGKGGNCS